MKGEHKRTLAEAIETNRPRLAGLLPEQQADVAEDAFGSALDGMHLDDVLRAGNAASAMVQLVASGVDPWIVLGAIHALMQKAGGVALDEPELKTVDTRHRGGNPEAN